MALFLEKFSPLLAGVVLTCASFAVERAVQVNTVTDLTNPIITILAINTGFLAAVLTILLTADIEIIRKLKTVSQFNTLIGYHWSGITAGTVAAIMSLVVIECCKSIHGIFQILLYHFWVFMIGLSFASFLRVIYILKRLLS